MTDWLNYHHLLYFWMVVREGGITAAANELHLSQPTLSSQIKKLEKTMGVELFQRKGRDLLITEAGQMVFRYADEIFTLGRELTDSVRGRPSRDTVRLLVGIPDVMPKLVVYRLLRPALAMTEQVKLVCYEGKPRELLNELALHRLDIVLADSPLTPQMHVRAFNHLLGECKLTVVGTTELVAKYGPDFPKSLNNAPMLLPTQNTLQRRSLEQWFDDNQLRPDVRHEFEDSAVAKVFGQEGEGLVVIPAVIEDDVRRQYQLEVVGRIDAIVERFYAISVERRLKHPAVVAIAEAARAGFKTE